MAFDEETFARERKRERELEGGGAWGGREREIRDYPLQMQTVDGCMGYWVLGWRKTL